MKGKGDGITLLARAKPSVIVGTEKGTCGKRMDPCKRARPMP